MKSSGDNPGDSKIPLDLVFRVRESTPRTGERTQTGAGKPGHPSPIFGSEEGGHGSGSRGESGFGRGMKPHASRLRATGRPGGAELRGTGPTAGEAPQLPHSEATRAAHSEGTGNRVSVNGVVGPNGAGRPADRGHQLRQRGPLRRATGSGVSGNGGRFAGRRGRGGTVIGQPMWRRGGNGAGFARTPGLDSGDGGRFADRRGRGGTSAEIRLGGRAGRQQGRVRPVDWPKKGIARRVPSGEHDGRCEGRDAG